MLMTVHGESSLPKNGLIHLHVCTGCTFVQDEKKKGFICGAEEWRLIWRNLRGKGRPMAASSGIFPTGSIFQLPGSALKKDAPPASRPLPCLEYLTVTSICG